MAGSMSWWEAAFDGISLRLIQTGCGKVIYLLYFIHRSQLLSSVLLLSSSCRVRQKLKAWSCKVELRELNKMISERQVCAQVWCQQ